MTVDVILEDERWAAMDLVRLADRAASATLNALGLEPDDHEIAILGCSDVRIAELNADFRGKPCPTNVLSWPSRERATPGQAPSAPADEELGDLAIAFETCQAEAEQAGITPQDHVTHLICHGILHLLGYDHETEADAALMEGAEIAILETLGISNPYETSIGQD